MTCKRWGFEIRIWAKPICLDALFFRKSLYKELQLCSFKHSMLDGLVEPKHTASNLCASDLASCQNGFRVNRTWRLHHYGFGLIILWSFILLLRFVATLDIINGGHVLNRQSKAAYIYIYIYIYMPVKVIEWKSLKQSTFWDVKNSTPLMGLEPTISRLHTEFH